MHVEDNAIYRTGWVRDSQSRVKTIMDLWELNDILGERVIRLSIFQNNLFGLRSYC